MSGNEKTPPCRTFRLCHKQLQIGIFFKEMVGGKEKKEKKTTSSGRRGHVVWMCRMSMLMEAV